MCCLQRWDHSQQHKLPTTSVFVMVSMRLSRTYAKSQG